MSTTKVANISNLAGTKTITTDDLIDRATCRAWVNFNGTGTVAIREDFNVSSITDNGTGDYTINFTNAMPDANYCIIGSGAGVSSHPAIGVSIKYTTTNTTSSCNISVATTGGQSVIGQVKDSVYVNIAVFR